MALDWGKARIGVAACDADGLLAYPVETVPAGRGAVNRIQALVAAYEPVEVVLGLPSTLAGTDGPAALAIRDQAAVLATALAPTPVCLVDERLTTAAASRNLTSAGRSARRQRAVIDQAAAVAILTHAVERAKAGRSAGEYVTPDELEPT